MVESHKRDAQPQLSVLAAVLHLPTIGTWRAKKAWDSPYAQGRWPWFFCGLQDRGGLPSATSELRLFHEFIAAKPHPKGPSHTILIFQVQDGYPDGW